MKLEGSSPHSQEPVTCPYPEPDRYISWSHPTLLGFFLILSSLISNSTQCTCGTAIHISESASVSDTPFHSIVNTSIAMNTMEPPCNFCGGRAKSHLSLHMQQYFLNIFIIFLMPKSIDICLIFT